MNHQTDNDDIFAPYNWISPNNVWDRPMLAKIVEEYHNLLKIHLEQDRYVKDLCIKFQLYVEKYRSELLADMNIDEVTDKIAIVNMILKITKEDVPKDLFYLINEMYQMRLLNVKRFRRYLESFEKHLAEDSENLVFYNYSDDDYEFLFDLLEKFADDVDFSYNILIDCIEADMEEIKAVNQDLFENNTKLSNDTKTEKITEELNETKMTENDEEREITDTYTEFDKEESMNTYDDEKDMQKYNYNDKAENAVIYKIYAENPLIGNKVLTDKFKENLFANAKKSIEYLKTYHKNKHKKIYNDKQVNICQMMVTLMIVHYAKEWDTAVDGKFWRYIVEQFGYRYKRDADTLIKILQDSIKTSMRVNKRWFIYSAKTNQNEYQATILAHAFAPKEAWINLCEFLFDFYKNNMNYSYTEDDTIAYSMIKTLQSKLSMNNAQDDNDSNLNISNKTYTFRVGIKKLIIHKPKYAAVLFSYIISRIDKILENSVEPVKYYIDELVNEWWNLKSNDIKDTQSKQRRRNVQVAKNYQNIRPKYILDDDMKIKIEFPDIRLEHTDFDKIELKVFVNDESDERESKILACYGNEFSKTISGFSVDLLDYVSENDDAFNVKTVILCDEEVIYNSEDKDYLYRNIICFEGDREKEISSCKPGKTYTVFYPSKQKIEFIGADLTPVDGIDEVEAFFMSLGDEFLIKRNDEVIATSESVAKNKNKIRIIWPKIKENVTFLYDGKNYDVIAAEDSVSIVTGEEYNLKKLIVVMNDIQILPNDWECEEIKSGCLYKLPLKSTENNICRIKIINNENNTLEEKTFYLSEISWEFDKLIYYSDEDYENSHVTIYNNDKTIQPIQNYFNNEDNIIPFSTSNGEFDIEIPKMSIFKSNDEEWNMGYTLLKKDIKLGEKLKIDAPHIFDIKMFIGDNRVDVLKDGYFALGNAVNGYNFANSNDGVNLSVIVQSKTEKQEYIIGKIHESERFVESPTFYYEYGKLKWDMGKGFIGNQETELTLVVNDNEYPLSLKSEVAIEEVNLPIGRYDFKITAPSDNVFSKILAEGRLDIGDVNELRFLNLTIKIKEVTDEYNKSVNIYPIYIKEIEYSGIQYVKSEERECPIYSGIMYYRKDGKEIKFSEYEYEYYNDKYYKVNPIRIVYLNEHVLSITDEEGDGLYYYHYKSKDKNRITDKQYTKANKDYYHVADLYIYEKERYNA